MPEGIGYSSKSLAGRRRRGLSQSKAKKIAKEGLTSAGNGFHSPAQKGFIGLIAGGGTPTRTKAQVAMKKRRRRVKTA